MRSIWIGFDPREVAAYAVCRNSIKRRVAKEIPVNPVILDDVQCKQFYWRKTKRQKSIVDKPILWDVISDAPMSTEFAISRFLTPHLAGEGWALFMDCDMMARTDFGKIFDRADPKYAVMCVKHQYKPKHEIKMDGQAQTTYQRKNWSSFMLFNCEHPSNKKLTLELINTVPGRDLHRFCWLEDDEIGELEPGWNWLVGEQEQPSPLYNVHYTEGGPWFEGYEDVPLADEWRQELFAWAQ